MRILLPLLLLLLLAAASCDVMKAGKIEGAVKAALAKDPRTSSYKFEVSYQSPATVAITGEVYKPEDVAAVTEIAKGVAGVTTVVNNCHIEDTGGNGLIQDDTVPQL